tara:strand:- start:6400 stop:7038 length:639 start_codon:yes stop_codon:yes gene_type:complete
MSKPNTLPAALQAPADPMADAAAWLMQHHDCSVEWSKRLIFPKTGPSRLIPSGARVTGSPEARAAAAAELRKSLTPASIEELVGAVRDLATLTIPRQGDEMTGFHTLKAYAEKLADYPRKVALTALKDWPSQPNTQAARFFPVWAELREMCERVMMPRRLMLVALERDDADGAGRAIPPKSEAVRKGFRSLLDELNGISQTAARSAKEDPAT